MKLRFCFWPAIHACGLSCLENGLMVLKSQFCHTVSDVWSQRQTLKRNGLVACTGPRPRQRLTNTLFYRPYRRLCLWTASSDLFFLDSASNAECPYVAPRSGWRRSPPHSKLRNFRRSARYHVASIFIDSSLAFHLQRI